MPVCVNNPCHQFHVQVLFQCQGTCSTTNAHPSLIKLVLYWLVNPDLISSPQQSPQIGGPGGEGEAREVLACTCAPYVLHWRSFCLLTVHRLAKYSSYYSLWWPVIACNVQYIAGVRVWTLSSSMHIVHVGSLGGEACKVKSVQNFSGWWKM